MLEMIKVKLTRRMKKKKEQMIKNKGIVCPKIQKKPDKMKEKGQYYTADFSGGPKMQTTGVGGPLWWIWLTVHAPVENGN